MTSRFGRRRSAHLTLPIQNAMARRRVPVSGFYFSGQTNKNDYFCSFFIRILLRNNVKWDIFFLLEEYVVMFNQFLSPIVIDCILFGGRRIRAAQALSPQRPPTQWFVYLARGRLWGYEEGWEGVILQKQKNKNRNTCFGHYISIQNCLYLYVSFVCIISCLWVCQINDWLWFWLWERRGVTSFEF